MDTLPTIKARLSPRKPRDLQLYEWMQEDPMNKSELVRELLFAYYSQRHNGGTMLATMPAALPAPNGDDREDPDDQLVKNLMGLQFDEHM